jgi:hypothetical protein
LIVLDKGPKKYEPASDEIGRKGSKSFLKILNVDEGDFGNYTCKGINAFGSSYAVIKLKPGGNLIQTCLQNQIKYLFLSKIPSN